MRHIHIAMIQLAGLAIGLGDVEGCKARSRQRSANVVYPTTRRTATRGGALHVHDGEENANFETLVYFTQTPFSLHNAVRAETACRRSIRDDPARRWRAHTTSPPAVEGDSRKSGQRTEASKRDRHSLPEGQDEKARVILDSSRLWRLFSHSRTKTVRPHCRTVNLPQNSAHL